MDIQSIQAYSELMNLLGNAVPEGTEQEVEIDDINIHFQKKDGTIKIEVKEKNQPKEAFDDSSIKELIQEYKENIEELDDDLFLEVSEELGRKISIKEFDSLLNSEHLTEDQANKVEGMIDLASEITCLHLQHRIQDLVELYEKF